MIQKYPLFFHRNIVKNYINKFNPIAQFSTLYIQ